MIGLWDTNNGSRNSVISGLFSKQREINFNAIAVYKNLITYLDAMQGIEEYDKKHIAEDPHRFSREKIKRISNLYNYLSLNIGNIKKELKELIKIRENENKDLEQYFSSLEKESIGSLNYVKNLLIRYNQQKLAITQNLSTMIPDIVTVTNELIGMEDIRINDSAEHYSVFINNLITEIDKGDSAQKGAVFNFFIDIIKYLNKYEHDMERLIREAPDKFIEGIGNEKKSALCFAKNFYEVNSGNHLIGEVEKFIEGFDKLNNGYYNNIKGDKIEKADKWAKEKLSNLFNCKDEDDTIKNKIGNVFKVESDLKELKKAWEKLKIDLHKGIDYFGRDYATDKSFNDILFKADKKIKMDKTEKIEVSISQIDDLFKSGEEKDRLEYIVNSLSNIINSSNKFWEEEIFENFIGFQVNNKILKGDGDYSSGTSNKIASGPEIDNFSRLLNNFISVVEKIEENIDTYKLDENELGSIKYFFIYFEDIKDNNSKKFDSILNKKSSDFKKTFSSEIDKLMDLITKVKSDNDYHNFDTLIKIKELLSRILSLY